MYCSLRKTSSDLINNLRNTDFVTIRNGIFNFFRDYGNALETLKPDVYLRLFYNCDKPLVIVSGNSRKDENLLLLGGEHR